MASAMKITFCISLTCFLLTSQVSTQKCELPKNGIDQKMPDVFQLFKNSVSFLVEVNLIPQLQTNYVIETYDKINRRGKLEIEVKGVKTSIVYFGNTTEYFSVSGGSCDSRLLTSVEQKEFTEKFVGWNWVNNKPEEAIIGPTNILRKAFLQSSKGEIKISKEPKTALVRGMETDVWTWCYSEGDVADLKIQFHFTNPKTEKPYGLDMPVPVRVTVKGELNSKNIEESYEFVGMRTDLPEADLDNTISIPFQVGCKRQATKLKEAPSYDGKDIYLEAELLYTPFINNTPGYTYANNFKIAVDQKNKLTSIDYAPWKAHKDAEMANPGDERYKVWDVQNFFVFDTDQSQDTCQANKFAGSSFKLTLPDGFVIDMGDWDLFIAGSISDDYQYLGETVERGIAASVFEKTIVRDVNDEVDPLSTLIITRYHVTDGVNEENLFKEENVILKVVVWKTGGLQENEFMGKVEVNFYNYDRKLVNRQQLFDVSACFTTNTQSKWVQIVFPLEECKTSYVMSLIPFIRNNIIGLLTGVLGVAPYRIPKAIVDVDIENVYITALILERPGFMLDFTKVDKTGFKKGVKYLDELGIHHKDGCAKRCIENDLCTGFSYCGALCTIATDVITSTTDLEKNDGCDVYTNNLPGVNVPTMDEISKFLTRKVLSGEIQMPFEKCMNLTAIQLRDDIAFGLNGLNRRPEGSEEDRFSVYKLGYKLDDSLADEGMRKGGLSFGSCKQACADKETCQSFSYCMATAECHLTSMHGQEIPENKLLYNTQCMVVSRNYRDLFTHFPGLSYNHEAEKTVQVESEDACAKACVEETSFTCKSFDFCGMATKDVKDCWLHKEHFSQVKEAKDIKVYEECGHFSRKYLVDFSQERHQDMSKSETGAVLGNLTAEDCALACKNNEGFFCSGFDHCFDPFSSSSTCTLRKTVPKDFTGNNKCNAYVRKETKADEVHERRKRSQNDVSTDGHSKSATGGLGFLMLLIGLGLGVGGIFGYGYWRANRR